MLKGVRVLDLSRVLAGPWATQMLADLGADVIKIERPGCGDDTRAWGPPDLLDSEGQTSGNSAYFLCTNRGKRSLTVNLASEAGQKIIRQLIIESEVLVENFRVGHLARFGLDYTSVSKLNPRLVYCSITGFGQTGPDAERPGYDLMIQAMGGLMGITGIPDGEPGAGPQKVGVAVSDLTTGMYASNAILAALLHARASGEGQQIDLSLFDTQLGWLANQAMNHLMTGKDPVRYGNAHPNIVPYQTFICSDGEITLAIGNDRQFQSWCELAKRPDLAADPGFGSNRGRVENRQSLLAEMATTMATRSRIHWIEACNDKGVPCGPVNSIAEAFAEPQAIAREMSITMEHPLHSELPQVANPIRFSATPISYEKAPPLLGQHTEEVLGELGYSEAEIQALEQAGAI
jgi:crotonobetainyl-CoA:carnitine CoA-transferase CaiB-like acyl-CoA transferase